MEPPDDATGADQLTAHSSTVVDPASHWAQVKSALAEGIESSGPSRSEFLRRLSASDPLLAEEVRELLVVSDQGGPLLDDSPNDLVEEMVRARFELRFEGNILGAYRVVRRIGRGGMGDVYLGERADGAYQKQVAIKLLRDALPADADVSRFERERQILAGLEHVNLAKIIDGGVTDEGMPYFVMELVDGVPLDEYCERVKASVSERVSLLRTVCQVVHYVNQRGVVHRDLKSRNILVTAAGVVKLLDFGIATRLDDARGAVDRTRTTLRSMTLLYASPEQVRGEPVGPGSDVYALGVVTFKLLTGELPYAHDPATASSFDLARAIAEIEPLRMSDAVGDGPSSRALRNELRGDLDAIVAKALRKDPATRYLSAEDLGNDLFRQQCLLPVQARRGAMSYRLGRWLLKHRAFAGAAIVANVALLAGLTVSLQQAHEAKMQRERAERNFSSVRNLANVFLFDFHDAVASLPGSMAARRLVIDKAQVYLKALAADAASDPSLILELAMSYRKIADIQGRPNTPNLGDFTGALANYDRSIALLRPLVSPGSTASASQMERARLQLARTYGYKGSMLSFRGEFASAEAALDNVELTLADVLRLDPDNVEALSLQASGYGTLSWVRHERGDIAGFETTALKCEGILQRILAAHPDQVEAGRSLQSAYARRGVSYLDRDKSPESARMALDVLQKWSTLAVALLAREPNKPIYQASAAESFDFLGQALQRVGERRKAIAAVDKAIALLQQEIQLDPEDDNALYLMMNAHIALANIYLEQSDLVHARDQALEAVAEYERRTEAARKAVFTVAGGAQAHFVAGRALQQLARRDHRDLARATDERRSSCKEFRSSLALMHSLKEIPKSSSDELSAADIERESASCSKAS